MTMPKGPMHKEHVLVIQVTQPSQGAFTDAFASAEVQASQKACWQQHMRRAHHGSFVVFESVAACKNGAVCAGAFWTCVPMLLAQAKANNIDMGEMQSRPRRGWWWQWGLSCACALSCQEEASSEGEVCYVAVICDFKLAFQFGRELAAAVLGKSELAHWKACQVPKEEETKMATDLQQSFENATVSKTT